MLLSWLQSVTGRALRERRPFRLHLPSSEGIDYLILRWDDTGQTERYDSRGRLLMRHQLSPGTGPTQTESVFSPLFNTFSPAFSLYLLPPAAPSFSRPFRLLVVSVQGRIRLDEVPSGGR
jgi:hypothetical protein